MNKDKRICIISGYYGNGKTEFALNYAISLAKQGIKTVLADLDFVNPYFRSREKEQLLNGYGVKLVSSNIKKLGSDLPAISGGVAGSLNDLSVRVVLDVGGDATGARVLSSHKDHLIEGQYDMFYVVNANRLENLTAEGVINNMKEIEKSARAKFTGLVNNTHLLRYTTVADILKGQTVCENVSKIVNLPIKYIAASEMIIGKQPKDLEGEILPINMLIREAWM
ncbi:MAG: ATP-binding protein [Clostridiales bacterium]|nr:ATP-binding protein [Clostridiales bacterium]